MTMATTIPLLLLASVSLALTPSCSSSTPACAVGTERCECTGGGSCDPGLSCLSNRCVRLAGDASAAHTQPPVGAMPLTADAAGVPFDSTVSISRTFDDLLPDPCQAMLALFQSCGVAVRADYVDVCR